jgi:hypothetical protein
LIASLIPDLTAFDHWSRHARSQEDVRFAKHASSGDWPTLQRDWLLVTLLVKLVNSCEALRRSNGRYCQPVGREDEPFQAGGPCRRRRGDRHCQAESKAGSLLAAPQKRRFKQNLLAIIHIADDFDGPVLPELQKYFE